MAMAVLCFLLILCCASVIGGVAAQESGQQVSNWICHYGQGELVKILVYTELLNVSITGSGGTINKDQCPASCNSNTNSSTSTTDNREYLGYIGAIVAVVFFGSNFIPVKKYETGDGKGCGLEWKGVL